MTRKALDPNLASILDSIRATVGAEAPPVAQPEAHEAEDRFEDVIDTEAASETLRLEAEDAPPAKAAKGGRKAAPVPPAAGRTVEEFLAELIRPQVEAWLNANLPELIQKMAADEIARLTGKR